MKPIPGFELYSADKQGSIYRTSYTDKENTAKYSLPHKLSPSYDRDGYPRVVLSVNGKTFYKKVHYLVALTFIPNPENKPWVNHIDGNKKNNKVENLEWVTPCENVRHAHRTFLHKGCRTSVHLIKADNCLKFESIEEAAAYLGHSRDCFRRHLTYDTRHGKIDGWDFKLIGGKERRMKEKNDEQES